MQDVLVSEIILDYDLTVKNRAESMHQGSLQEKLYHESEHLCGKFVLFIDVSSCGQIIWSI
eukprot:5818453-Amphidinium_carterae.1